VKEEAMTSPESAVRAVLDSRAEAAWDKDLDRLMSLYSPDIVYYDIVPPLRYEGSAALRGRFADWFGRWQSPIGQELHTPTIVAGGDVAAAHMLIRASGILRTGREVGYWVRVSNCFRQLDHGWSITHEHVSLPVDLQSGTVVMDLVP
jgi:ketosteroid isomerase-like protein